jgi:hypothetical protein
MKRLSRRAVLRGTIAGGATVALGLPVLDAMLDGDGALADGPRFPDRFVLWFWGNGSIPGELAPAATGPLATTALSRGLEAVKHKTHMISGTRLPVLGANNPHVEGSVGMLSATNAMVDPSYTGRDADWDYMTFGGPSIDEVAAEVVGGAPYRSVVVSLTELRASNGPGTAITYTSHRAPYLFNSPMNDPRELFAMLFGAGAPTFGMPTAEDVERARVLDAVLSDAHTLERRLGAADRERLGFHLDALRSLEARLAGRLGVSCSSPTEPENPISDRDRARIFSELISLGFACDLTRVASVQFSSTATHVDYPDVFPEKLVFNGAPTDFHAYVHQSGPDETVRKGIQYFIDVFGDFLSILDARPEGGGSLLDHSVVLGTSELGAGWNHRFDDMPIVIAGGGNGRLRPGSHVRLEGASATRAPLTCLHALGAMPDGFGRDQLRSTDPISEILV